MLIVALTGGIGSGKSAVASLLAARGAAVIDSDAISRSVTATGGAAILPIAKLFGDHMIAADGSLERSRMRELIYTTPAARQRLEAIVHPLVRQKTHEKLAEADRQQASCAVLDVPLLLESPYWIARSDRVLVVDCTLETQVARVRARNGLSDVEVRLIVQAQAGRAQRRDAADIVIFNDACTLAQLEAAVARTAPYLGL